MTSRLAPIADPKVALGVLAPDDVRRLHAATLEVIETVGVRFPSPRALDIWAAHGATVDRETFIVRAPGELIERAIASAPAEYTLAARDPAQDLPFGRTACLRWHRRLRCRGAGPRDRRDPPLRAG